MSRLDLPTFGRPTNAIAAGSSSLGGHRGVPAGGFGVAPSSRRLRLRRRRPRRRPPSIADDERLEVGPRRSSSAHASASASRALRASLRLALGRQRPDDRVEQVAGAAAVGRRDRVGLLPAERVELGGLELALLVVGLVDGDDHRLGRRGAGVRAASRSAGRRRRSSASTTNTMTSASAIASRACSWTRASIGSPGLELEPAGVDDDEPPAVPLGVAVEAVAGRPGAVLDDGRALADEPVEQRALADVRPADDGDDREARACAAGQGQARAGRRRRARRQRGGAAGGRRGARRARAWASSAACARASGVPAIARIRSATSRRSSIGVEVPPVTPTTRAAVERRRRRSGRGRSRSGWRGVPAISHSRVSSLVLRSMRPPTTTIRSTSRGRLERVLLAADRDRADGVDDLELVGRARP